MLLDLTWLSIKLKIPINDAQKLKIYILNAQCGFEVALIKFTHYSTNCACAACAEIYCAALLGNRSRVSCCCKA
jgi:hypothetical protein